MTKKTLLYLFCVSRYLWNGGVSVLEVDAFLLSSSSNDNFHVRGNYNNNEIGSVFRLYYEPLPNDSLGNFAEHVPPVPPVVVPVSQQQSPAPIAATTTTTASNINSFEVDMSGPDPEMSALDVTTLLMDALQNTANPQESLALCFAFSSDACRAALGGDLDAFIKYANNPTFGALVHCQHFVIQSVGPIIPGSVHRGDMQTVLVEITKPLTVQKAIDTKLKEDRKTGRRRPTIEERMRARKEAAEEEEQRPYRSSSHISDAEITDKNPMNSGADDSNTKTYLWTLQKERRPPRQGCWLVHECLYNRNAFFQTT